MRSTIVSLRRATRTLALAAALSLTATARLHAQSVLNGSFEDPGLITASDAFGSGADWTVNGTAFVVTNGYGNGTSPYGNQCEHLFSGTTDSQTLSGTFTLNATYILSLAASDVFGGTGDELTLTVSGGATATQTFAVPSRSGGFSTGPLSFATYMLAFTPATSTPVIITLANTSSEGDYLALDNVQIVPEPTARALLGLAGAALLGLPLRKRHARRT